MLVNSSSRLILWWCSCTIPLAANIFRSVMQRLAQHPNALYLVYVNPLHAELISVDPRMKIVASDDWCTIWKRGTKK